jgi:uncharacterized protein (TIGR00730 family)
MTIPRSVCVYCGSSGSVAPSFRHAAAEIGRILAENGIQLVYGGGRVGLMGLAADAALAAGGAVVGVIPRLIAEMEVAHQTLTELIVVETMHERKRIMAERSDAFLILPGGYGTLDEMFEILTWKQLGLHDRPIVIANLDGYWDPLMVLIRHALHEGFIRPPHATLFAEVKTIDAVLPALAAGHPAGALAAAVI